MNCIAPTQYVPGQVEDPAAEVEGPGQDPKEVRAQLISAVRERNDDAVPVEERSIGRGAVRVEDGTVQGGVDDLGRAEDGWARPHEGQYVVKEVPFNRIAEVLENLLS